jgi:hypothetical protein
MVMQFFKDKRPHKGLTYKEYTEKFNVEVNNTNPDNLNDNDKELFEYKKLNFQRTQRIEKSYEVSEELKSEIENIKEKQIWMVITESWCGDSAQNLPYLAKIASLNSNIDFRVILRDSNPDIMDLYLTNGTRSIPKLVAFDSEGNELFTWGPRPKAAQELINQWKNEGIVKPELYEKLHLWYGRNRGKDIEAEFLEIISKVEQE